jgi:uncharacterized membrane protein
MTWIAVLGGALASYLLKLAGWLVPPSVLERPRIARSAALLPASLLASLVVIETFTAGQHLVFDARAAGLAAAVIALLLRAPFLVVVIVAAAVAAGCRALGWT